VDDQRLRSEVVECRLNHRVSDADVCYVAGEELISTSGGTGNGRETEPRVGVEALCCSPVLGRYRWSSF